jgi:hypothetical protein
MFSGQPLTFSTMATLWQERQFGFIHWANTAANAAKTVSTQASPQVLRTLFSSVLQRLSTTSCVPGACFRLSGELGSADCTLHNETTAGATTLATHCGTDTASASNNFPTDTGCGSNPSDLPPGCASSQVLTAPHHAQSKPQAVAHGPHNTVQPSTRPSSPTTPVPTMVGDPGACVFAKSSHTSLRVHGGVACQGVLVLCMVTLLGS